ncbi:cytidine deaminase [Hoylesella buccalis]|uniref:Cytidine deaminase n=1 Tax=Hoylesella buccalis TaxID=28127 RepID=A0A2N6QS22_9BACT|nr:cytidine deaminase [Hoylesella buccalis]PMC24704.1 cytidine deaminase [Hoylesella buccalis]
MEQIDINISIQSYQLDELSPQDQELVQAAIKATNNAYANYSRFYVGAALRLENGKMVIGANQENAAFPSGLCAERTAVFAAQANYPDSPIETLAIAGRNEKGVLPNPITPCGACRQVILEIEDRYKKPIKILLYGTQKIYCVRSVKDLLPLSFVDDNMR